MTITDTIKELRELLRKCQDEIALVSLNADLQKNDFVGLKHQCSISNAYENLGEAAYTHLPKLLDAAEKAELYEKALNEVVELSLKHRGDPYVVIGRLGEIAEKALAPEPEKENTK